METRNLAWKHSGSHPRLPVTGRRGWEFSFPAFSCVVQGRRQFGKRYILGQNSHFRTVPTLITSSLHMNFWDDRPILTSTNHKQRTTNLRTFPFFPQPNALSCRGEMIE